MDSLPIEIIRHIYEFCIDKRLNWEKLTQQFLKGGFNRKNLKLNGFLQKEHWCAKRIWEASRPELYWWKRNINFDYRYGEWSIKKKFVVVTFTTSRGLRNIWSAKEPVSRWLKNIKKFETKVPKKVQKMLNMNLRHLFWTLENVLINLDIFNWISSIIILN